jgi:hypothetical protein
MLALALASVGGASAATGEPIPIVAAADGVSAKDAPRCSAPPEVEDAKNEPAPSLEVTDPREPSGLTKALRARGYSACMMPDTGFGHYTRWQNLSLGQIMIPRRGGATEDGGYDVVLHFHGHDAVRRAFAEVASGMVLAAVDLGVGSGVYEDTFELPEIFAELQKSIVRALVRHSGNPAAHIRHLALSSWSAGYGAIIRVLKDFPRAADAVILLDSLHAGYVKGPPHDMHALHGVHDATLVPVLSYAKRAAEGETLFFLTHSDVRPPGYASTGEVADFFLASLGGGRFPLFGRTPLGAELISGFDERGFHVRGYAGRDEVAHCAHTELLAEVVRDVLEPTWKTPPAER